MMDVHNALHLECIPLYANKALSVFQDRAAIEKKRLLFLVFPAVFALTCLRASSFNVGTSSFNVRTSSSNACSGGPGSNRAEIPQSLR